MILLPSASTTLFFALLVPFCPDEPRRLFGTDGIPEGWSVRRWDDVSQPIKDADWTVKGGILRPGQQRGTWLLSDNEFGDFVLEFEIKLSERGNSGVALRAPANGDPAFDGLEFQI